MFLLGKLDPMEEFVAAPSTKLLQHLQVDELWRVGEHYNLSLAVVSGHSKKKEASAAIQAELVTQGMLEKGEVSLPTSPLGGAAGGIGVSAGLTFAEQKELLAMQIHLQELQVRERHLEREAHLELERIGQPRPLGDDGRDSRPRDKLGDMLCLLPKINEKDPVVFFSLFESLAEERSWSEAAQTTLIESVLPPKAQEAYLALDPVDRRSTR